MKTCCRPGEMLCAECMAEEEEPRTVRLPRKEESWTLPLVHPIGHHRPYKPVHRNPPKLRRTPTHIPIYEVIESYDYPVV